MTTLDAATKLSRSSTEKLYFSSTYSSNVDKIALHTKNCILIIQLFLRKEKITINIRKTIAAEMESCTRTTEHSVSFDTEYR